MKTNNPEKYRDWTGLALRFTLALVMFPHAIQHTTGGFGGYGYKGMMDYFTGTVHLPWIIGFMVIATEVLTPVLLVIGLAGRLTSLLLMVLMTGIILTSHLQFGFFMNWLANQKGEGYEYHLLYLGLCVALLIIGSGRYSLDHKIAG